MVIDSSLAPYFQSTYIILMTLLSVITYMSWNKKNTVSMLNGNNTNMPMLILFTAALILIIGLRPHSGVYFGDTNNYKRVYVGYQSGELTYNPDISEWMFSYMQAVCAPIMNYEWFLVLVACGYFGCMLLACKKLFGNNAWGGMLFMLSAFSTFSYGTNGIRNGMACSIILLGISLAVSRRKINLIIAVLLSIAAMAVHKSTTLPVLCFVVAYFFRSTKLALVFWAISILLNLVAHGAIESFFGGLGFDDRLTSYIGSAEQYAKTEKSGFRPDFLLYSAMPIWMAYYVLVKRGIKSRVYSLIANTYIYANSFWVMLMQASFSNRFAYLSWFMLPIVLAYPCLCMNIWDIKQGKTAARIMLAHSAFTFFMTFIY